MTCEGPEAAVCAKLEAYLDRMGERVVLYRQVRMLCFTHANRVRPANLRIDYVARIDDGPIVGIEVKAAITEAADLGRALFQCSQYAAGVIGSATCDRIAPNLVGQPLAAVLLYTDVKGMTDYVKRHGWAAHRLYGPANVGFLFNVSRGLEMRLCGERYWTEWSGWHQGMISKGYRSGNGTFKR